MRAVTFNVTIPGYVLARTLGRYHRSAVFGGLSGVRLRDLPTPGIPGAEWARLKVIYGGICGSDLGNLRFTSSPAMEPFGSFPAVLGHEILAEVQEVGDAVRGIEVGQRVVVDPVVSCVMRGHAHPCSSCQEGLPATCGEAGEDGEQLIDGSPLAPGITLGYHRHLAGGWGETLVAHQSQLYPVSDALDDRTAALTEPLAIAMHAVLRTPLHPQEPVLVIGSGPIAFATIWALRATGFTGTLVSQAKRPHEAAMARALGASEVVRPGDEAREALIATGAHAYQPIVGPEVYAGGGFPVIFDCVGSAQTLSQLLSYSAPRARGIVLGCAAQVKKLDLTFLWAREIDVKGFVYYGREQWRGEARHTFEITNELMVESGGALGGMVTDIFPLEQYRDALRVADDRRSTSSIKVLLKP